MSESVNQSVYEFERPTGNPKMQLLFFHGLQLEDYTDAHVSTWKSGDGSCIWPQEWLVKEFPGAHVLYVSYDGRVGEKFRESVFDMDIIAENLISDLMHANVGQIPNCPVILVGHSLGGLVIKQMCYEAHKLLSMRGEGLAREKLENFLNSLKGIFFYGTPHQGSPVAEKAIEEYGGPLLDYFKLFSKHTARLNHTFDQISRMYNWRIEGVGESNPTKWGSLGYCFIAPEASTRQGSFNVVDGTDHFTICKPMTITTRSFYKLRDLVYNIANDVEEERQQQVFGNSQHLPHNMVRIDSVMEDIKAKIRDFRTLGIVGGPGIGKSTLAKAIFNELCPDFEYSCFVADVKLKQGDCNDIKEEVLKLMYYKGKKVVDKLALSALEGKRLLLVLDDIAKATRDGEEEILSIMRDVTASESRFIVTSQEDDAVKSLGETYKVPPLSHDAARKLFESFAFPGKEVPPQTLQFHMETVVKKCEGLPLTLTVLGKFLKDKRGVKDDVNMKDTAKAVGHLQEALEYDPGLVVETPMFPSGIAYSASAEEFRREVEGGGEDGYFVSSNWLLNLSEHERDNLLSVLQKAGYSEIRQTSTTTLFARTENDWQNQIPYPRLSTNVDVVGAQKGGDDLPGIGRQGLNTDNSSNNLDDVCTSENPAETSNSIHRGSRTFDDEITGEMSPAAGESRAARWSKSFQAALESKSHQSFHVSTKRLSNLKDREREALEAGYEKISETKFTTRYEKVTGHVKNPTGAESAGDNDSSKSSNRNDITGRAVKKPSTSESDTFLGERRHSDDEDGSSNSSDVKNTTETRRIQDRHSFCHPQLLSVKLCSSTSRTTIDLPAAIGNRKQLLGDTIVEMPETDGSQNISTSIERPFKLKAMSFPDGECHREVLMNLKAIASMTISCCVRVDPHKAKVRFKISRISGEVKNKESSEEDEDEEEDLCHEMVLSSVYTTVYGYMKSPTESNIPSGQIFLNLEDEYFHMRRRRILVNAEQSEGDSTDSADLLWLEISGTSTSKSHTGFTGLVLRGDINGRRKDEEKRKVPLAEPLLFHEPRPVIVEGDIQEYHPNSFIEFHITHKLEYSFFQLSRGRHFREEGPFWAIRHNTKAVDFDCCLEMKTKGLLTQHRIKSTPM